VDGRKRSWNSATETRHIGAFQRSREQVALHRMDAGGRDEFLVLDGLDASATTLSPSAQPYADDRVDDRRIDVEPTFDTKLRSILILSNGKRRSDVRQA